MTYRSVGYIAVNKGIKISLLDKYHFGILHIVEIEPLIRIECPNSEITCFNLKSLERSFYALKISSLDNEESEKNSAQFYIIKSTLTSPDADEKKHTNILI